MIVLDKDPETAREIHAQIATPDTVVELVNSADDIRWDLHAPDLTWQLENALGDLSWRVSDLRSYLERANFQREELYELLEARHKRRNVIEAAVAVSVAGLNLLCAKYRHWEHATASSRGGADRVEHHWGSTSIGVIVVADRAFAEMALQVDVGNEPPPVAPPGVGGYFVDGRRLKVAD